MKTLITFISSAALAVSLNVQADGHASHDHSQMNHEQHMNHGADAKMQAMNGHSQGEVKRINLRDGKVTLKHDKIEGMDMPPMTMDFKVQNAAMLQGLKRGDHVSFSVNAAMEIIDIRPTP